jgi:hypothetical protein
MRLAKRTYALPSDTIERFEEVVGPGKRSAVVAQLVAEWLAEREREALRRDIEEGCREMWEIYLETAQQWGPLDAEVDRALGR